jgi:hypothetical protein
VENRLKILAGVHKSRERNTRLCSLLRIEVEAVNCKEYSLNYACENIVRVVERVNMK